MTRQERADGFVRGYKALVEKYGLVVDGCESCKIIYLVPYIKYAPLEIERHFIELSSEHEAHFLAQLWEELDALDKARADERPVPQEEDYQI
jgi:hypothetical protein